MSTKDKKDLENEVQHIFDSGANELRILEMVETFIDRRYISNIEATHLKAGYFKKQKP